MSKENDKASADEGKDSQSQEPKEPVNLRKAFPMAFRVVFRRSIHWIVGFFILVIAITVVDHFGPGNGALAERVFFLGLLTVFLTGIFLLSAKLVYELVYYHVYYYGTELEHLVISRGIFFKTRASFPFARMADVYIDRTPLDLLFMLYNLRITTHSPVIEHGAIEGLSFRRASDLQNYLLAVVNTTVKPVDEKQVVETLQSLKATEDAGVLGKSPAVADPPRAVPPPHIEQITVEAESLAEPQPKPGVAAPKKGKNDRPQRSEPNKSESNSEQKKTREFPSRGSGHEFSAVPSDLHERGFQNGHPESQRQSTEDDSTEDSPPAQNLEGVGENSSKPKQKSSSERSIETKPPEISDPLIAEVVQELVKTHDELEQARRELSRAERVVEHAKEVIERSQ